MGRTADPIALLRASTRRVGIVGCICLGCLSAWAMWSMPELVSRSGAAADGNSPRVPLTAAWRAPIAVKSLPFDPQAFDAVLWKEPPRPVEAVAVVPPPPPPPVPLNLQLVGVRGRGDERFGATKKAEIEAVLLDPESNRLHAAAAGERVQRFMVRAVSNEVVELVDPERPGSLPHVLRMQSGNLRATVPVRSRATKPAQATDESGAPASNARLGN